MRKLSIARKISLIIFATFLCLILLEIALRSAGFILLQIQEYRNRISLRGKKEYRILCLRDSATVGAKGTSWPSQLEQILNERNTGVRFRVIDKAGLAITSSTIGYMLEKDLNQYQPDMVITMIGSNDGDNTVPFEDTFNEKINLFFTGFKVYNLAGVLWSHKVQRASKTRMIKPVEGSKDITVISSAVATADNYRKTAEVITKEEIATEPNNDQLYASLGHFYNTQRRPQEAEEAFKKAIEINPNNDSAYNGLGDCYYTWNRYQEAEQMFKKAIEINPDSENAYLDLTNTYQKQGRSQEAEEMFKKVIEIDPNNEGGYVSLGHFYNTQGRSQEAEEAFKKAIEINPDSDNANESLGHFYNTQGRYQEAEGIFKRLKQNGEKRYFSLGHFYNTQGRYKEAEEELKKAIEIGQNSIQAYVVLGDNYRKQGKYQEAEEALRKALAIILDDPEAYNILGDNYKEQGKYQEAEEAFKKAIEINPLYKDLYVKLGSCYIEQERYKEAVEMLEKGISLNPDNDDIYVTLALCYGEQKLGNDLEQENLLKQALKANSNCDLAYLELGRLYVKQGRYQEAEEALKKTIELNSRNITTPVLELGYCYTKEGNSKEMQDLLTKITNTKIKDDRLYAFLAVNYQEKGDYDSAERFFKEADRLRSNYYCPSTRYNYQSIKDMVTQRRMRLVSVQYPMRSIGPLKKLFDSTEGIIFVDNEKIFKDALRQAKYEDYFKDYFGGDFGHCTPRGNRLLAENITEVILKEIF